IPATAERVLFPMPDGSTRAAWNTVVQTGAEGWYDAVVDAGTGEVLVRRNLWESDHNNGEANVFLEQHPQIPGAAQQDFDFPANWADDSGNTIGNNSDAWHDPDGDDSAGYRPDTGDPGDANFRHFNYTYTDAINSNPAATGTDWVTDRDSVITQAFYYTNMLHDHWYQYGFDEASGNFQEDNFGLGGDDGDRVNVLVDWNADNGECCNASMATPDDGDNPFLRLRVGLMPDNRNMHRAMNGDTVTHEFGHGVSNRLVGGGDLGSGVQTNGMGEGWSDAMAFSLWNDPVYGEYNNGNNTTGIRGVAYDTSGLQYDDICNGGCEEHNDGEVWATALWDVRDALIGRYGQADGTFRFEHLMIDGMKNTPTDPSFLDARDGILASNVDLHGGVDTCLIWAAFAVTGMGSDADDDGGGSSPTNGFAVPAACIPTADAGGPYAVNEGATIQLDATGSTPGTDPGASTDLTYAWDFDGDAQFDDATGAQPTFGPIGDNMVINVAVQVTSGDGISDTDSTTVTVLNVAPSVAFSPLQVSVIDE
ncbi:MAG TPA: M36 family metallopeptidase, partial [Ilumatobacteraceae bacterium]